MTATSKINVEVDAAAFDRFYSGFKQYSGSLKDVAAAWEQHGDQAKLTSEQLKETLSHLTQMADNLSTVLERSKTIDIVTGGVSRHWNNLARTTGAVARNIGAATTSLLKWAGLTGLIGGLMGGVGWYGLDHLASGVGRSRTTALGLGTSYGGLQSFRTNLSPVFDNPDDFLARVNAAMSSPEESQGLRMLGVGDKQMAQGTFEAATSAILQFKDLVDKLPEGSLKEQIEARHLPFSLEEAVRIKRMSRADISNYVHSAQRDRGSMDLSPKDQLSWQAFSTQMRRAGVEIENVFVRSLAPLAEPLKHLSSSIIGVVQALTGGKGGSNPLKDMIEGLSSRLEWLTSELDKPEFQQHITEFFASLADIASVVGAIARGVGTVVKWFADIFGITPAEASTGRQAGAIPAANGTYMGGDGPSPKRRRFGHPPKGGWAGNGSGEGYSVDKGGSGAGNLTRLITEAANAEGIDPNVMEGIRAGESGHTSQYDRKDDAVESSWGPFQLNRRRGLGVAFEKDTGLDVRNPSTIPAQARWVAHYIKQHGGTNGQWMGYHGPRNADPRWGDSGYVPKPKVTISTQPGGNAAASANSALAVQ